MTQPTKGCRMAGPRKTPTFTTLVAMPESSGGLTSLAQAHDSVRLAVTAPMAAHRA